MGGKLSKICHRPLVLGTNGHGVFADVAYDGQNTILSTRGPMESHTYHIGDVIFAEGDPGDCAYLIKSGEVKITKIARDDQPRTIATLRAGNIIGEMALIDQEPRAASAVVLQDAEVLIISNEEFQKRLEGSDQVIGLLMQTFTNRLRQQAQQLVRLLT